MTFRVKYDISGELVRHTGLTVTYWVTVTYCGPTRVTGVKLTYSRDATSNWETCNDMKFF